MTNARLIALDSLLKVNYSDGYSNIVINKAIKKSELSASDKALATAIFYGVLERKITLDYIISQYSKLSLKKISKEVLEVLRMGLYQLLYMDKIPSSAAVNESVNLIKMKRQEKATGFVNGILRSFLRNKKKFKMPESDLEFLSIKYSCPIWIIELFLKSYGKENTIGILTSLSGSPPINIRVNTLKISPQGLMERLKLSGIKASISEAIDEALILESTGQIDSIKSFNEGLFHVQDLASQICCKILDPQPGQTLIDVCAAPGGKTFTLAELMNNQGKIMAFDQYDAKVNLIKSGASRLGISIITAKKIDARNPSVRLSNADRVLCDVPCSGLGIIRRKPEIRYKKKTLIEDLPKIQYNILCESAKLVKIGGILVYSTCTLNLTENNYIADRFIKEHFEFVAQKIDYNKLHLKRNNFDKENQLTLMPHIHGTDGFFIAAFKKVR